mgnify:CR=1 FL=1
MGFETSYIYSPYSTEVDNKAVPMGFETTKFNGDIVVTFNNKAVPMGFETHSPAIYKS